MKITVTIECECGETHSAVAKRTTNTNQGKVYEDYSCISEGFEDNPDVDFHQSYPDGIDITCKCGRTHELML